MSPDVDKIGGAFPGRRRVMMIRNAERDILVGQQSIAWSGSIGNGIAAHVPFAVPHGRFHRPILGLEPKM